MRSDRVAIAVGIAVGLAGGAVAVACLPSSSASSQPDVPRVDGRLLDEAEGTLDLLAFHYVAEAAPITDEIYRAFFSSLPPKTRLLALVPPPHDGLDSAAGLETLLSALPDGGRLLERTSIALASDSISPWSKDRALVASSRTGSLLLAPSEPTGSWSRRRADWNAPMDLAAAFSSVLSASSLPLDFDAGDFAVTGERLLVDANLLEKNRGRGIDRAAELAATLERMFGMPVVVLGEKPGDVPRHHLSMYLTPLTDGVILLGDPREGRRIVGAGYRPGETSPETGEPLDADFSEAMLARYDRSERELARAGFKVVRIPTVPFDDKTYFAYTNGVFETRAGKRMAWVPTFGVPALDQAALGVYRAQGWEVRPIPSRAAFRYHGTIGCLVNPLVRGR